MTWPTLNIIVNYIVGEGSLGQILHMIYLRCLINFLRLIVCVSKLPKQTNRMGASYINYHSAGKKDVAKQKPEKAISLIPKDVKFKFAHKF